MYLFFDSYHETGSGSLKFTSKTYEELCVRIVDYTLEEEVTSEYFEIKFLNLKTGLLESVDLSKGL